MGDIAPRGSPDGVVDLGNYVLLVRLALELIQPTTLESILDDTNTDAKLNIVDMLRLQQAILNGTAP